MQGASRLCGLKNCKHGCRAVKVDEATTVGGDRLIVARAGAEEVAEFIVAATEALRRDEALEAPHTSCASFDAPMILLEPIVFVRAGPMLNPPAECRADRPRVGAVPVRGDALGVKPVAALAERKKACAAAMARCSLSMVSTRLPSRSIARYR